MAQLDEAVERYHQVLEHSSFRDLAWAEKLQAEMQHRGLSESGRPISPVLRPYFVSRPQLTRLGTAAARLSSIMDRLERLAFDTPELLNRLHLLPAEKVLGSAPCGYGRSSLAASLQAVLHNGSLRVSHFETCKPAGLGYADVLAELFLHTPVTQEFCRRGFVVSKIGGHSHHLLHSITDTWKEYGGHCTPRIAVVEMRNSFADSHTEGEFFTRLLSNRSNAARLLSPDQIEYSGGSLHAAGQPVDLVYRRLLTRELLVRFDLSHPLLRAYRDGAACVVNGFRSELSRRRALLELVTDGTFACKLSSADRVMVEQYVPWTRIVAARKTRFEGSEIDLISFASEHRDRFVLRPNDDDEGHETYVGAALSQTLWDRALRSALQKSYVLQTHSEAPSETFPVLQYGEVHMQKVRVTVNPYLINGKLQGALAQLELVSRSFARPFAVAPVLVIEEAAGETAPAEN